MKLKRKNKLNYTYRSETFYVETTDLIYIFF